MLDFSVTFIITIINITILFLILRKVLFKPVTKVMADRAKRVQDSIVQAERDKSEAKQLLERYEAQLKNAHVQADEIIRLARETANAEAERIIAAGKSAAETMQANARRQIEAEHEAALAQFKTEAALLVIAASSRLLGRELQTDDNRRYANMLIDELSLQYSGAPRAVRKGNV